MGRVPRRYSRHKVESVVPVDLGPSNGGILLDLGEGGLACRVVSPVVPSQYFRVRFKLQDNARVEASGQVAWVDETGKRGGLRFLDLPAASSQAIGRWLNGKAGFGDVEEESAPAEEVETAPLDSSELSYGDAGFEQHADSRGLDRLMADEKQERAASQAGFLRDGVHASLNPYLISAESQKSESQKSQEEYELLPAYRTALQAQHAAQQQALTRARHRKLIFAGFVGFLAVFAIAASLLLFRSRYTRVADAFADLKGIMGPDTSSRGAVGSATPAKRPTTSKSFRPRVRRSDQPKGRRAAEVEGLALSAVSPREQVGKPAKTRGAFQLEVVDSSNRRWLVTSSGGNVVASQSVRPNALSGLRFEAANPEPKGNALGSSGPPPVSTPAAPSLQPAAVAPPVLRETATDPVIPAHPPVVVTQHRIERGSIVLQALIGKDGSVQSARVVSGPSALAAAVLDLVRVWRYPPYYQNGELVEVEREIRVDFTISTK